tara:strand:+ start:218 stop:364 length:147 start_codon:yes stop_codon:yes gene_type:complete
MNQKFSTLFFLFFILILFSACYTVTYPETCPGVSEVELEAEDEIAFVY